MIFINSFRVPQDQNNAIASQEHLADIPLSGHGVAFLASISLGHLGPHLAHVLKHHVHMPVEGLHPRQQFPVVA